MRRCSEIAKLDMGLLLLYLFQIYFIFTGIFTPVVIFIRMARINVLTFSGV